MKNLKIKKGDKIIVLSGKDSGKTGIVEHVNRKNQNIIVSKINTVKKHLKSSKNNPGGGIIDIEKPLPVSKVELICPSCDKRTRVGYDVSGKKKVRICKKCGKPIVTVKAKSEDNEK